MKHKLVMLLMAIMLVGVMSGCGEQIEDLLGKANQLLDEQLENTDEEAAGEPADVPQVEDNAGEPVDTPDRAEPSGVEEDGLGPDDGHGPDDDGQTTTVDELIASSEYDSIDLPNGWPLPLPPADWHLVQMIKDPEDGHEAWEGGFCFAEQGVHEAVEGYEKQLFDEGFSVLSQPVEIDSDSKHATQFQYNGDYETVVGDISFFVDKYGNGCATIYFTFE